jgi:hypothetical protein
VLLPGLIIAQAIATIQVYLSNNELYRKLEIIRECGYLPVPNEQMMPYLKQISSAFWGGLFFTLSLGAGLSLVSLVAAWAWDLFFQRKRIFLVVYSIFWIGILIVINFRGLNLLTSVYFLLIPPLVFRISLCGHPPSEQRRIGYDLLIVVVPVFLLATLWLPHMDRNFFGDFRDRLLLSNRFGQKINQFYYDHTLYAAEVFKSLDQKTIKTCIFDGMQRGYLSQALERELRRYDYLTISGPATVDLQVTESGNWFILAHSGITIMKTTLEEFLTRTGPLLKEFSLESDRQVMFRKIVFFSLLLGFPIVLYIFFLDLFRFGLGFFLPTTTAALAAALVCLCMGTSLLVVFSLTNSEVSDEANAAQALRSSNLADRVAALKIIERKGLEISSFAAYDRLLSSPHISERYWLVRTLGVSHQTRTYQNLLGFLDDPHLNVVCMAYYALGRRGDRQAVPEILKRITTSQHWYIQWYAYQALKTLGWTQSRQKRQSAE